MSRRFKILKNLLAKDGAIFVHLDHNETAYCKVLMDEVFSRSNYVETICLTTNEPSGFKATSSYIFSTANFILVYAKNKAELKLKRQYLEKDYDTAYSKVLLNKDEDFQVWRFTSIREFIATKEGFQSAKEFQKKVGKNKLDVLIKTFAFENPQITFRTAAIGGGAKIKRKNTIAESKTKRDQVIMHPNEDVPEFYILNGEQIIFYDKRFYEIDGELKPGQLITNVWTDISWTGIASEGGVVFKNGKKPEKLVQRCFSYVAEEGDLVLDSFLGSGTTAAVAHKMGLKYIGVELGEQAFTHCRTRLQTIVSGTDVSGITKTQNWKGGGGFKFYTLAPSLLKKDKFGNEIINPSYNADMLAAAMAKQEGFKYQPHQSSYWKQGQSAAQDFIFTTTQFLTVEALDSIKDEMQPGETLLICCKSFQKECKGKFGNITIKKIPLILLGRCEYGKEDYSLNIINMPVEDNNEDAEDSIEEISVQAIRDQNKSDDQTSLF
jgi:adenine-specific DNA-methyltransferase